MARHFRTTHFMADFTRSRYSGILAELAHSVVPGERILPLAAVGTAHMNPFWHN